MKVSIKNVTLKKKININNVKLGIKRVYPELEDIEITPSGVEQNFKATKYGYNNVKVRAVEGEEINIVPTTETQQFEGLYKKVNVSAIETEETTITPSAYEQVKEGLFNKVTVAGDEELKSENIKQGVSIFGVEGIAKTSNVKITDASYLFYSGARTEYLYEILNLCENISSAYSMFYNCGTKINELNLSNFDTSNVTNMRDMFGGCKGLQELNLTNFNTSKVTDMSGMFSNDDNLNKLDVSSFDTNNVTTMRTMFYACNKLKELDLSDFNMDKVYNIYNIFYYDRDLVDLKSFKNLGKGYVVKINNYSDYKLDLSTCSKLSYDSLMSIINNLYDLNLTYDVANGGTLYTQSLVLGSTNLAKLTAEEIAIATNKGWSVS